MVVVSQSVPKAKYYRNIPVDYIHEQNIGQAEDYYLIMLKYGSRSNQGNLFNANPIERHDIGRSEQSQFLHPVVYHFFQSQLISEHHVIDDLAAEWLELEHIEPLKKYLKVELAADKLLALKEAG